MFICSHGLVSSGNPSGLPCSDLSQQDLSEASVKNYLCVGQMQPDIRHEPQRKGADINEMIFGNGDNYFKDGDCHELTRLPKMQMLHFPYGIFLKKDLHD